MDQQLSSIRLGDCIEQLEQLPAGSVDLAFADPPFNIGYKYDVYDDRLGREHYIDWSAKWIAGVYRALKSNGTFWLAIGDEYAAELKIESQRIGFTCRSWVVWYYTFGVNCTKKFTRSHAHLFYFVKDAEDFTFRHDDLDNRIPSARELVYNDKRANPRGRLPDDTGALVSDDDGTWSPAGLAAPSDANHTFTLRPQDLDQCFEPEEDTWYFPRVAGTFKERAGFHGCQMPEQLLGRIIRSCSAPGDLVLDPFSGSATTLAVAKKLGRGYLGFELSPDYVQYGLDRLASIKVGDRLDGSPEPLKSAPRTAERTKKERDAKQGSPARSRGAAAREQELLAKEQRYDEIQLALTLRGVVEAFRLTHDGYSADRLIADPALNQQFTAACDRLGLVGDARTWNSLLLRQRKAGKLLDIETAKQTTVPWQECDAYMFASEIALQCMLDQGRAESLDEILCDPALAEEFDRQATRLAPGHQPFEYRWAALRVRKAAKQARSRGAVLNPPRRLGESTPLAAFDPDTAPTAPGLYLVSENRNRKLYVGETADLRRRLQLQFGAEPQRDFWSEIGEAVTVQVLPLENHSAGTLAWQSCLAKKFKRRPQLNYFELCTPC